jgi:hypothetical protein
MNGRKVIHFADAPLAKIRVIARDFLKDLRSPPDNEGHVRPEVSRTGQVRSWRKCEVATGSENVGFPGRPEVIGALSE